MEFKNAGWDGPSFSTMHVEKVRCAYHDLHGRKTDQHVGVAFIIREDKCNEIVLNLDQVRALRDSLSVCLNDLPVEGFMVSGDLDGR